jgi:16S rRNA processing protein RimM
MMRSEPSYLVVGHLNKAHGTKGELFVWPLTDHPESAFAPGVILHLGSEAGDAPDPTEPSLSIVAVRPFRRGFLLSLEGVGCRDDAEALQGRYVLLPRNEIQGLEEGEVFYHQLLGMEVVTPNGDLVGTIREVYELRPADLLEIRGPNGTHFVPFLKSIIQSVDADSGTMVIDPPEGMLDL